jgi:hypothetical protein
MPSPYAAAAVCLFFYDGIMETKFYSRRGVWVITTTITELEPVLFFFLSVCSFSSSTFVVFEYWGARVMDGLKLNQLAGFSLLFCFTVTRLFFLACLFVLVSERRVTISKGNKETKKDETYLPAFDRSTDFVLLLRLHLMSIWGSGFDVEYLRLDR